MSRLEIILCAATFLSLLFSAGIFIYARGAVTRLLAVSEELGDLQQMTNAFANHLQAVYQLDSFYGDATLKGLLDHAISLNEQMETFEYIYSLTEETPDTLNLNDTEEETN